MLKFTAKPKLKITFKDKGRRPKFYEGEEAVLRFYLANVGHWYSAKPAATNTMFWVNFDPAFEPNKIRYGSSLEKENRQVRRGKGNSKYLKASKIHLFYEKIELGEDIEILVKMPKKEGVYPIWIPAHSDQGDCGVNKFKVKIVKKDKQRLERLKGLLCKLRGFLVLLTCVR